WRALLRESAPALVQAWELVPGVCVSNRGVQFPVPFADPVHRWMLLAFVLGILGAVGVSRWSKKRQARTGAQFPSAWVGVGLVLGLPLIVFLAAGAPLGLDRPELKGLNFVGGSAVSADFRALLFCAPT